MQHESDRNVPRTRGGKVRLRSLDDLDHRTAAAKRARDLVAGLEADAGGAEQLSTGQRELCKRAALAGAILEDVEVSWIQGQRIDVGDYALLANSQRRLLATIGIERQPRLIEDDDMRVTQAFMKEYEATPP
jgi:hypothetical protein